MGSLSFVRVAAPRSASASVPAAAPLAGSVPASFAVVPGTAPVPRSAFVPVAGGGLVTLSGLAPYRSRAGAYGVTVRWTCVVSGLSGELICLSQGFPGGEGSPAARAFLKALRSVCSSGTPVYVAGAPGANGSVARRYFCAFSLVAFAAPPAAPSDPFEGF